jgi:ankyrin repeat protein
MQALTRTTTSASASNALPAARIAPMAAQPAVTAQPPGHGRNGTHLLDSVVETRRFRALMSFGIGEVSAGKTTGGKTTVNSTTGISTTTRSNSSFKPPIVLPGTASRSGFELYLLQQNLLAIASKPADEHTGAPAVLLEYLKHCDEQAAKELLDTPAMREVVTSRNRDGDNVLHMATQQDMAAVVERLVKLSPDPTRLINAESGLGLTALFIASMNGNTDLMRALLAHPAAAAQAAIAPKEKWNPLMAAAMDGQLAVGMLLLATPSGAEQALATDCHGRNALMFAALHGQPDFAGMLLAHPSAHAQAAALDDHGANALMLATEAGHASLVKLFLTHPATAGQVIEAAPNGEDALIIAARNGWQNIVDMLLAEPMADILLDGATCTGSTALMLAAQNGHAPAVAALLSAMTPEQANQCGTDGFNALMLAAEVDHAEIVSMLLADSRTAEQALAQDRKGLNALTIATLAGSCDAVETLLNSPQALAQVVAIGESTINTMVAEVLEEGLEKLFPGTGTRTAMFTANTGAHTGKRRYQVQALASVCPPQGVMKLLPIIARKLSEKRGE